MDTVINRKSNKKKYLAIAVLAIVVLGYGAFSMITKKRTFNVKKSEITIKSVEEDYFEDFMVFQARVEPMNSMLVNIVEGGSVQEIFVSNGDMVIKGQPLARLYNPNTELNYMQQETAIIEQINNLNKAKLDLRNQELNLAKDLVSIEHDFLDAKNLYDLNKKLFEQEILAKNEWEKTQENFRYQKERMNIIKQSVTKEKQANQIQIGQLNQSIGIMEKSLGILRTNKKNFLIVAPLSGRLSSFEPVLGQSYQQGQTLGKIDVMKGYKLLADVDEFYLSKVKQGQNGTVDFNGKEVKVVIAKVIPEIKSGRFQVELNFVSNENLDLQQGLSFAVRLTLSEKTKSVVLSKGSFNQDTSGKWIFVVNGNKAERRNIEIGRENPLYFEIISGLKLGEQVVTSSYKDYQEAEILNFE
ncbi:efflux RND transporter periplasmic adaptor subunit [Flavobacterium sp.]|uniref:efflux RND transporter periplasmic adaptor subunit n=1 Tax=Flavobacterium sp. TaxID=239 RepID=UPI0022BBACDC|nr:efflux RND transporter periplasmic adaptor subunit [Flavobacterium sp.]MCZ8089654.1 efflux RND transporter periplasmic adaptor subunit [Flavobacterium sp.]